jgi:hypothetical protein
MVPLLEELVLMNYLNIKKGKATVTKRGEAKLENFKSSLSSNERKVLEM